MKEMIKTKKKGFTLIELLAVIVVLAILALIAVPIVLNIIKDARNNSNKRSIESYARAIDYAVSEHMSENPDQEIVTWEEIKDKVEYKGKVECQWGEGLSSILTTGEITLHGCKVNNKTNSLYGYVNGKVVEEKEIVYSAYNVGDEITYKGINFYVIAPSDTKQDYVTLLKAEPLTVDEVNAYGEGHVNAFAYDTITFVKDTAYNQNGYGGMAYYSSSDCNDEEKSGCNNYYDKSDVKYVVDAWAKDKFQVNDLKEDAMGYSARLITKDELITNFGYELKNGVSNTYLGPGETTPSWIHSNDLHWYWYWTMSLNNDSSFAVAAVSSDSLSTMSLYYANGVVRPVINLKKSAI